jgi:hypothetical protein
MSEKQICLIAYKGSYEMMFRRLQKQLQDTELGTGSGTTGTRTCTYVRVQWGYNETEQFREDLQKKHGSIGDHLLAGVCFAGDGLLIQIIEPVTVDLDGKPSRNYMNRKGFFALLVQAFCGAYIKFWYFNVGWPGATNDITAYKQTDLYHSRLGFFPVTRSIQLLWRAPLNTFFSASAASCLWGRDKSCAVVTENKHREGFWSACQAMGNTMVRKSTFITALFDRPPSTGFGSNVRGYSVAIGSNSCG